MAKQKPKDGPRLTVAEQIHELKHLRQGAAAYLIGKHGRTLREHSDAPRAGDGTYDAHRLLLWMMQSADGVDFTELLEQEKYREKKRENDLAEGLVAPVDVLENTLARGVAAMIPVLETLPLLVKRHWPEITGDQTQLVKQAVAKCRNALADLRIDVDDD